MRGRDALTIALLAWLITTVGTSWAVSLTWDPSPGPGVAGYELHVGLQSGDYDYAIDAGMRTSHPLPPLAAGKTHYFAVSAYDAQGRRSAYSNEVNYLAGAVDALVPSARFDAMPTEGTAPMTVHLTSRATGSIAWYRWDFGDGSSFLSDSITPLADIAHTYDEPGAYTVRFTATGPQGTIYSRQVALVTVAPAGHACPCSLFGAASPTHPDSGGSDPINIGVRFKALKAGFVTGIRFYKSAANVGPHRGDLWSTTGQRLATTAFREGATSGWQEARFASPIAVTAGQVLVASYHAPTGHHAKDDGTFLKGFANGPLQVLPSRAGIGNGVYAYGGPSTFPDRADKATNFGVDVLFAPGSGLQAFRASKARAHAATLGTRGGATSQPRAIPTVPATISRTSKLR